MSNINLVLSELTKVKGNEIELPYSKKTVELKKPRFKFQEEIIQIFENIKSEQSAIVNYRKYINNYVSNLIGNDINILDRNFYILNLADKISNESKYKGAISSFKSDSFKKTFEYTEDDINFKFELDLPKIKTDDKFIQYASNKKDLKIVEYAFCEIFRFVHKLTLNDNENLVYEVENSDINSIYNLYVSLPVSTCSKLIEYTTNNFLNKIKENQNDVDIEQDPSIFVSI